MNTKQLDPLEVSLHAAFLMEGMRDASDKWTGDGDGYAKLLDKWGNGCIELVAELIRYAPVIEDLIQSMPDDAEFAGVYDYEVSNPFGFWFAEYVYATGCLPTNSECINELDRLHNNFFSQVAA